MESQVSLLSPEAAKSPSELPENAGASLEISVLVPVLNEADSVQELATRVAAVLDAEKRSFEMVFVDDGSSDGTPDCIKQAIEVDPRVKLVRLRRNFGKAAALCAGFDVCSGSIVITMDGDLQDQPEEIPRFLEMMEEGDLDLVSGWKENRQDPLNKRYPSRLFNWVTRKMAQIDLHDFNCGFKAYRREVLEQISLYGELHRYIPVLASRKGFTIGEVAVVHNARQHGKSKYGWDRYYKGLLDLITVLFITKYTRRPLHLFGVIGLSSLAGGLAINSYLMIRWFMGEPLSFRPLLLLGVLLMLLGIQVLTTGLIGEMITFKSFRRTDTYSVKERVL